MTLVSNSLESGAASGTAATTTLSATGGTAFTTVTPGTGSVTYDSAAAAHGSLGLTFAAAASSACYVDFAGVSGASNTTGWALRFYVYVPTLPTANAQALINLRTAGGGTSILNLQLGTTGTGSHLFITCDTNAGATLATTTGALSAATLYRVELAGTNPTATTGTLTLRVYAGDSTTAISNLSIDASALNYNTVSAIGSIRYGRTGNTASAFTVRLDDLAFQTGSTTLIGPFSQPVTVAGPVASAAATAPVGTVSTVRNTALAGPISTATGSALAGAVAAGRSAVLAGALALAAATAPAGSVTAQQSLTLAGPVASVAVAAPAGGISTSGLVTVSGPVASVTAAAPTGAVHADVVLTVDNTPAVTAVAPAGAVATELVAPHLAGFAGLLTDGASTAALVPAIGDAGLVGDLGRAELAPASIGTAQIET